MPQLGGTPGIRSARSEGGVGAAVYSVKAKPLILGVTGVVAPLVVGSSDMTILTDENSPEEVKSRKLNGLGKGTKANRETLAPLTLFFLRRRDRDRS